VTLVRQVAVELANGKITPQACKEAQIPAKSYYRRRKEFGALKLDQAKRLEKLERENAKLKRLVAEMSLEKQILKDVAEGNF
jgi:putative transposase